MFRINLPAKIGYWLALLPAAALAGSIPVQFNDLLKDPRHYHAQRITVEGVARVEGESFVLCGTLRDAEGFAQPSKDISVAQKVGGKSYDDLDNQWVAVTGVVDADRHGMWNFPCEILLEAVRPLPRPGGKKRVIIRATFRNQASQRVYVALMDYRSGKYAEFDL